MRKLVIAGNWKMYKEKSQVAEFMDETGKCIKTIVRLLQH